MLKYFAAGHKKGAGNLLYLGRRCLKAEENPFLYSEVAFLLIIIQKKKTHQTS